MIRRLAKIREGQATPKQPRKPAQPTQSGEPPPESVQLLEHPKGLQQRTSTYGPQQNPGEQRSRATPFPELRSIHRPTYQRELLQPANQPGHFARNCPQKRQKARATAAQSWQTDDGQASTIVQEGYEQDNASRIDAAIAAFTALSLDERDSLASTIGGREDTENRIFPDA